MVSLRSKENLGASRGKSFTIIVTWFVTQRFGEDALRDDKRKGGSGGFIAGRKKALRISALFYSAQQAACSVNFFPH